MHCSIVSGWLDNLDPGHQDLFRGELAQRKRILEQFDVQRNQPCVQLVKQEARDRSDIASGSPLSGDLLGQGREDRLSPKNACRATRGIPGKRKYPMRSRPLGTCRKMLSR
jgi:hypothetical protein